MLLQLILIKLLKLGILYIFEQLEKLAINGQFTLCRKPEYGRT